MKWTFKHTALASLLGMIPKLTAPKLLSATQDFNFLNPLDTFQVVDDKLKAWEKEKHYTLLTPLCEDYPASLLQMRSPPLMLFVLGHLSWQNNFNLAVVGRREPKTYTHQWMDSEFFKFVKPLSNINIISGGARGIDQKAHLCAITLKKPTTVVLPSGLEQIYPTTLNQFKDNILENKGCFISTYLPETPMYKKHFHDRNELIAALSSALFIVEAQVRSGTYKTALYGIELHKPMGVLPSFPTDINYSGSMQLLYDGAHLIRDHKDLHCFTSR